MTQPLNPNVIAFTPELVKAIQARLFHRQRTPSAESLLLDRGFDPEDFYRAIDDVRKAETQDLAIDMARLSLARTWMTSRLASSLVWEASSTDSTLGS